LEPVYPSRLPHCPRRPRLRPGLHSTWAGSAMSSRRGSLPTSCLPSGQRSPIAPSSRSAGHRVFTRLLLVVRRDARFKIDNNSIDLDSRCDKGFGEPRVSSKLRDARSRARRGARCEQEERASVGLSLCDGTRQFNLEPAPFPWVVLVMTQLSVR
jgi:hypothetical protein